MKQYFYENMEAVPIDSCEQLKKDFENEEYLHLIDEDDLKEIKKYNKSEKQVINLYFDDEVDPKYCEKILTNLLHF